MSPKETTLTEEGTVESFAMPWLVNALVRRLGAKAMPDQCGPKRA